MLTPSLSHHDVLACEPLEECSDDEAISRPARFFSALAATGASARNELI